MKIAMFGELWGPSGLILLAALLGAIGVFWAEIQKMRPNAATS